MNLDIINGLFESCGALMLSRSVWMTYKAKKTEGVSILAIIYFSSWGLFNLFYYPSLNQPFSFLGGCLCTLTNLIWCGQIFYYRRKNNV